VILSNWIKALSFYSSNKDEFNFHLLPRTLSFEYWGGNDEAFNSFQMKINQYDIYEISVFSEKGDFKMNQYYLN